MNTRQGYSIRMGTYSIEPISPSSGISPECIAEQMTLIDFEIWCAIEPVELLNQCWTKDKIKYRAPNVLRLIARFNELSGWVASNIVWQEKLKKRTKLFKRFIKIAKHCFEIGNYHSSMAVVAGLNTASVARLKFTRSATKLQMKVLESLEVQLNATGSYHNLRELIRNKQPPIIPYIGVYLGDLIFIDEGNPDELDGLINFHKQRLTYSVILQIQQYQAEDYKHLEQKPEIKMYLSQLPGASEKELFDLSLLREPRGATKDDIV